MKFKVYMLIVASLLLLSLKTSSFTSLQNKMYFFCDIAKTKKRLCQAIVLIQFFTTLLGNPKETVELGNLNTSAESKLCFGETRVTLLNYYKGGEPFWK